MTARDCRVTIWRGRTTDDLHSNPPLTDQAQLRRVVSLLGLAPEAKGIMAVLRYGEFSQSGLVGHLQRPSVDCVHFPPIHQALYSPYPRGWCFASTPDPKAARRPEPAREFCIAIRPGRVWKNYLAGRVRHSAPAARRLVVSGRRGQRPASVLDLSDRGLPIGSGRRRSVRAGAVAHAAAAA